MSLIALALAATLSGVAPDPAADNEKDLRCIALISAVLPSVDTEENKSALTGGLLYFIGRIDGRTPNYDLAGNLARISKLPASELAGDSDRCVKIMSDKGEMLQNMGNAAK